MRASERRRMDRMEAELAALEREANGTAKRRIQMVEIRRYGPDLYQLHGVEYTEAELEAKLADERAAFKRTTVHPNSLFIEVMCPHWSPPEQDDDE